MSCCSRRDSAILSPTPLFMIGRGAIACWRYSWAAPARNGPDWITADRDQRVALEGELLLADGNAGIANCDPPIVSKLKDDGKEQDFVFEMSSEMGNLPFSRCVTIDQSPNQPILASLFQRFFTRGRRGFLPRVFLGLLHPD